MNNELVHEKNYHDRTNLPICTRRQLNSQNFILAWFDPNVNEQITKYHHLIDEFHQIFDTVHTYNNIDHCVDFISGIKDIKAFLILSNIFDPQLITLIHNLSQLYSIYILRQNYSQDKVWIDQSKKVKLISFENNDLCNILKEDTKKCDHNLVPISTVSTNNCLSLYGRMLPNGHNF